MGWSARAVHALLATEDLTRILRESYAVGADARMSVLALAVNSTYRVDDGSNAYVLRVQPHNHRSRAALESELDFLEALASAGVSVAPVMRSRAGERIIEIAAPDGSRHATLFGLVEGREAGDSVEDGRAVGAAAAELHRHAAVLSLLMSDRRRYDDRDLIDRPIEALRRSFGHRISDFQVLTWCAEQVTSRLADARADLGSGAIHGDLQQKNALVDGEHRATLIDFDECGSGWLVDDLASWTYAQRSRNADPTVEAAFLESYSETRPLTGGEAEALPWLVIARAIYWMGWQIDGTRGWGPVAWLGEDWFASAVGSLSAQVETLQ